MPVCTNFQTAMDLRMRATEILCWVLLAPVLLTAGGGISPSHAQQFISGPSMGLDDAKSMLRNPATVSFHRPQIAIGAKAHHIGISNESGVPLRQGFVAGSTPFLVGDRIGLGGSVRYFDTPIFKKGAFGASLTGRLFRFLSVGVRVSALNLSYNRSEFVGVEPGDPVFEESTGKTTFTGTVGVFAKPLPNLNLAVGGRNLNRPDLALGSGEFRAEPEVFGGASYGIGAFRVRVGVSSGEYGVDTRVGIEAYATDGSYLRVGSDASFNNGRVEGQLHVSGPLSVNYQYNVPTSDLRGPSTGSHQFSVLYEFGRSPEVPEMPSSPSLMMEAERSEVDPSFEPRLHVSSSHETVQHVEKRIEREINVPDGVLQNVSQEALGTLDSTITPSPRRASGQTVDQVPDHIELADILSAEYDSAFAQIGQRLDEGSPSTLEVLTDRRDSVRAYGLYNRLRSEGVPANQVRVLNPEDSVETISVGDQELPLRESLSILNPEQVTLRLLFPYLEDTDGIWTLTVTDRSGETVKIFNGSGEPRRQINWEWTDDQGDPLDQGEYTLQFEWQGQEGTYQSNKQTFSVSKTLREVTIEVTRSPEALDDPADALELRPKK